MPPAPRFRTNAISELYRQLRFAPIESRRREMDAAERLVGELDAAKIYPQDFIVFRVTGYRPVHGGDPVMLVGEAVKPDLVSMVQRLSLTAALPRDYRGRTPVEIDHLRRELGVSARTLQRYRRQGLVYHYVQQEGERPRLVCFRDALERFLATNGSVEPEASPPSRVGLVGERAVYERARSLRRDEGLSLDAAARRLAPEIGRARETVRRILRRRDAAHPAPVFTDRGPLRARERRLLLRAWAWGVPTTRLADRFDRSAPALHRALNLARRQRLAATDLAWIDLPTFELPDAERVILSAPPVVTDLAERPLGGDLLERLAAIHARTPSEGFEDAEDALVAAYNLLKRRAAHAIGSLSPQPTTAALDAVETDLRWATLVKRRLVAHAFPATILAVENYLHRRLREEPVDRIVELVELALRVCSETVETLDPTRGQHLERRAGFDMGRVLARRTGERGAGRAAARHLPGKLRLTEAQRRFCPWQRWLDPPAAWSERLATLPAAARDLVERRYGWNGAPPQQLARLAKEAGSTPSAVAQRLRAAERLLRG